MELTYNQFEVLTWIERRQDQKHPQREVARQCRISLGIANKTLAELRELGLLEELGNSKYAVTGKGYEWLEPYRVKRAIFMAAGFGSRLVPVTLNTPKPLVKVRGKRMIDTLLDAVLDAGITDIVIVRGYLGEQFDLLLDKYPMLRFVENPIYNESNNISSAYVVRDLLENAYMLESDLVLNNPNVIRKYEYATNYLGMPVDVTDDWCFETKGGYITKVQVGGRNVVQMCGVSYWTAEDAKRLEKDIDAVYHSPGGKERYWDEVALREYIDHYKVMIRQAEPGDLVEIDTYNELKREDPAYQI